MQDAERVRTRGCRPCLARRSCRPAAAADDRGNRFRSWWRGRLPGALVSARQIQTNVLAETTTDKDGRFRFPYLKVGPYEIKVHLEGFRDATRQLTLTVGSAFDLPIALSIGIDTSVTVTGDATILE